MKIIMDGVRELLCVHNRGTIVYNDDVGFERMADQLNAQVRLGNIMLIMEVDYMDFFTVRDLRNTPKKL